MNKMLKYVAGIIIAASMLGCGQKLPQPDIYVNVFQDSIFPCLKVVFPDAIEYNGMQRLFSDNETVLTYSLKVSSQPQYDIKIIKRYTKSDNVEWILAPIPDQYADAVTLYSIPPSDDFFERSAVVVLGEDDGNIYIRAVIGEYVRPDTVFMITIDRLIQKKQYRQLFAVDEWQNSTAGKRLISDMTERTNWYYERAAVINCNGGNRIDRMWWG